MDKPGFCDALFGKDPIGWYGNDYFCRICNVKVYEGRRTAHEKDPAHMRKLQAENDVRLLCGKKWQQAFRPGFCEKIDQIKDPSSKAELYGLLYQQIFNTRMSTLTINVDSKLEQMHKLEKIAVLGLYIWKQLCTSNIVEDDSRRGVTFWREWFKDGWKERKVEMYPSMKIVLLQVRGFLGSKKW